jgi:hypothetical protein
MPHHAAPRRTMPHHAAQVILDWPRMTPAAVNKLIKPYRARMHEETYKEVAATRLKPSAPWASGVCCVPWLRC